MYLLSNRCHNVAFGVEGSAVVVDSVVDVFVVPSLCVFVFGCVAGVVEPVGPVYRRATVEECRYGIGCSGSEVVLGDECHGVVVFWLQANA